MTSIGATWPEGPPEVPPPWRPAQPPDEPHPSPPAEPPVPFVPAGHEQPAEHDPFLQLLRRRIVLVSGALTGAVATAAAAQLMSLDADDDAGIELHLNCPDGDLDAALMLADAVELTVAPVTAISRGALGGAALVAFAVAGHRLCHPHAIFRMREPSISISGRSSDLASQAVALGEQFDRLTRRVADAAGQPPARVRTDMADGRVLSAQAALEYGLVHEIVAPSPRARGTS